MSYIDKYKKGIVCEFIVLKIEHTIIHIIFFLSQKCKQQSIWLTTSSSTKVAEWSEWVKLQCFNGTDIAQNARCDTGRDNKRPKKLWLFSKIAFDNSVYNWLIPLNLIIDAKTVT